MIELIEGETNIKMDRRKLDYNVWMYGFCTDLPCRSIGRIVTNTHSRQEEARSWKRWIITTRFINTCDPFILRSKIVDVSWFHITNVPLGGWIISAGCCPVVRCDSPPSRNPSSQRPHTAKCTRKFGPKKAHFWLTFFDFRIQQNARVGREPKLLECSLK